MPPGDYQGQFHWHNGQWRLTIDACSIHTSDRSFNPRFTADFAFHSLPILPTPVLIAWNPSTSATPHVTDTLAPLARHAMARPEFFKLPGPLAPPLGSAPPFPHHALRPLSQTEAPSLSPVIQTYPYPLTPTASSIPNTQNIDDRSQAFATPPTSRKVLFGSSPQSLAQKSHSAAFGIREPLPVPPSPTVWHKLGATHHLGATPTLKKHITYDRAPPYKPKIA